MTPRRSRPHPGSPRRRGPGRPSGEEGRGEVRRELLEAAARLFARRGYGAVGIRAIAAEAGVTPAMVSYYFGGKAGLYEEVFEQVLKRLLARVRSLDSGSGDARPDLLAGFARLYAETLAHDPWIPELLVREVLSREGPMRRRFRERFARPAAESFRGLVARSVERGELRDDLDPTLAMLSLVGMMAFPFLAEPVLGPVLGYAADARFARRLAAHSVRLFREGAGAEPAR